MTFYITKKRFIFRILKIGVIGRPAPRLLGVNLITAFIAASVVDIFETTLDKIVLLAILMPIVPSMGGVAGTQSLTIMTRALALGHIDKSNLSGILRKEILVGLINGILWAVVVGGLTYLWFKNALVGIVIAGAMTINLIVAALAGFLIPITLKKFNIDPAIASTGAVPLYYQAYGSAIMLSNGGPMKSPADFKDKKIRVFGKTLGAFISSLGGKPALISGSCLLYTSDAADE